MIPVTPNWDVMAFMDFPLVHGHPGSQLLIKSTSVFNFIQVDLRNRTNKKLLLVHSHATMASHKFQYTELT